MFKLYKGGQKFAQTMISVAPNQTVVIHSLKRRALRFKMNAYSQFLRPLNPNMYVKTFTFL
jgi:hypothetical protein